MKIGPNCNIFRVPNSFMKAGEVPNLEAELTGVSWWIGTDHFNCKENNKTTHPLPFVFLFASIIIPPLEYCSNSSIPTNIHSITTSGSIIFFNIWFNYFTLCKNLNYVWNNHVVYNNSTKIFPHFTCYATFINYA